MALSKTFARQEVGHRDGAFDLSKSFRLNNDAYDAQAKRTSSSLPPIVSGTPATSVSGSLTVPSASLGASAMAARMG